MLEKVMSEERTTAEDRNSVLIGKCHSRLMKANARTLLFPLKNPKKSIL